MMSKKIVKGQEHTHKNIGKKTDGGDTISKNKGAKPNPFAANKRVLYDRGDTRKYKTEETQIKYDATKINKAVEVNDKCLKQSSSGFNKNGAQIKQNNSKFQSNGAGAEVDVKLLKCNTDNVNMEKDGEVKARDSLRIAAGNEIKVDRRKVSPLKTSAGGSDREKRSKTKNDDCDRPKLKEVINIPYIPEDEPQQDTDENLSLSLIAERTATLKTGVKPKVVTFKDCNERSPKFPARETKRPDSKTRWQKRQNSGKKRCRKTNSPSSIKNNINESLPTEVVKWSPSSVNNHTKPYYEAWVDRSLTAFSKCSEKERLKLEKEIIETLEHFKRPVSPELRYERINDEAYTGKIKVRRR